MGAQARRDVRDLGVQRGVDGPDLGEGVGWVVVVLVLVGVGVVWGGGVGGEEGGGGGDGGEVEVWGEGGHFFGGWWLGGWFVCLFGGFVREVWVGFGMGFEMVVWEDCYAVGFAIKTGWRWMIVVAVVGR